MKNLFLYFIASIIISISLCFIIFFFAADVILAVAITISLQLSLITGILIAKHKR
ncbi:hypothetical protein GCM10008933_17610 [Paenibacillus motobuensis]|uniref:Uncharacterized protein n=1 Tax=Paenibacillus motobuensis TaxID=295324 RepID=A0ABN0Y8K3_9BACL